MAEITGIEWTNHTWGPWWGCTHVGGSPACFEEGGERCYAETWANRLGYKIWGADTPRRFFGEHHWNEPLRWNKKAESARQRRRVFCMSMGDWAEGRPDQRESLERLWPLIKQTDWLDWLMLTKRPQLIPSLYPKEWQHNPLPNVWLGTTAENQYWMDLRWGLLRKVDAAVHFFSIEPLFGSVTLPGDFLARGNRSWAIVGGQSGPKSKAMHPDWYRGARDQCLGSNVPFFFKQHGEWVHSTQITDLPDIVYKRLMTNKPRTWRHHDNTESVWVGKKAAGHLMDGQVWQQFPLAQSGEASSEDNTLFPIVEDAQMPLTEVS
jgi:protein gp37